MNLTPDQRAEADRQIAEGNTSINIKFTPEQLTEWKKSAAEAGAETPEIVRRVRDELIRRSRQVAGNTVRPSTFPIPCGDGCRRGTALT